MSKLKKTVQQWISYMWQNKSGLLTLNQKRRRGYNLAIVAALIIVAAFVWDGTVVNAALPAPGGVDNESLWLKANDGASTNATWFDQSAIANNATQLTVGNQPILNNGSSAGGINFNPAYTFDNVDDRFNINSQLLPQGSGGKTVLYVTADVATDTCNGVAACNTVIGWGNSSLTANGQRYTTLLGGNRRQIETAAGLWGNNAGTNPTNTITPGITSYVNAPSSTISQTQIRANGSLPLVLQLQASSNPVINVTSPTTTAYIGQTTTASRNWAFGGKMSEVIVYSSNLSAADRLKVESYLAVKYGITLDQTTPQSYVNSAGSIVWTGDASYKYNITGIGRDDSSTLNQKQSKSVNPQGIVTVGHGDIAADNVSNTNNFASNLTFLAFGDDNNSATSWTDAGLPPALDANYKRVARTWKVQETGTVNNLTVSFDVNDTDANIPAPIQDYYLINLTTGQATPLSSSDGNNYATSGVDFNNGDTFTIGTFDAQYNVHYRKTVSPIATSITPGQTFTYTVTAENIGNVPLTGLSFTDDLSDVIDDATYNNDVNATIGNATFNGPDEIEWNGNLGVGQTASVTYSFTMNIPATGDGQLNNSIVGSGTGSNCTADPAVDPDCQTTTPLPVVTSQKTLLSPANPEAGDTVNYQIIIENQGAGGASTVSVADDLTDVLDDAVYNHDASATSGILSYDPLTKRLSWNGSLAANGSAGDSVTITLSVTINAANSLGDAMLNNAVISPNCPNPAIFDTGDPDYNADCVTSTPVTAWIAQKTVTGTAQPGSTVSYTIQVENTGAVNLTGGSAPQITDDLSDVIDDATYNNDANATTGNVSFTDPTLTWTGNLNAGQSASVTYTATVKAASDLANSSLANAIVGSMNCPATPITDPNDPNFNVDCAVVSQIAIGSTPDPDASDGQTGTGDLANTGQPIAVIATGAVLLIASALGIAYWRRGMIKK